MTEKAFVGGIYRLLRSQADIDVICEASNGSEAVRMALQHKPDVVLMDVSMPVMNGLDATRRIKHELPSTVILMVSQFDSAPFEREALMAGAAGYILKDNAAKQLIPALRVLPYLLLIFCAKTRNSFSIAVNTLAGPVSHQSCCSPLHQVSLHSRL